MSTEISQHGTQMAAPQKDIIPARRERLPETRKSITHKFTIDGHEGYLTIGLYPDGRPGELFLKMAKQGSTVAGLVDTIGVLTSLALQYGVPPAALAEKFAFTRFEPSGRTANPEIRIAHSVVDYIFRWIGQTFVEGFGAQHPGPSHPDQEVVDA